jgi:hypothetical protein
MPRDVGRRSDAGSIVLTSASTRSNTSSNSARLSGPALVLDVAGSSAFTPGCTLVLNVGCTPGRLLLRSVATFPLTLAVLAALALALAVAALASERARRRESRDALRVTEPCVRFGAATTCTYIPGVMAHMCDYQLNDLTHEFDARHGGHAVTLPRRGQ